MGWGVIFVSWWCGSGFGELSLSELFEEKGYSTAFPVEANRQVFLQAAQLAFIAIIYHSGFQSPPIVTVSHRTILNR